MIEFTKIGIQIGGGFIIYYYAIILVIGAMMAGFLADRQARYQGLNPDLVWDGFLWALIGGLIGARLWHVFTPPPSMVERGITTAWYFVHPLDLLNTRLGGLGIPGAVIGGGLGLYLFCRRKKISFLTWADIAAPAVALGQAIGRWGNLINQELYGKPTDLPWAITIDTNYRLPGYENFATYHPLFLYESLWNFANMGLLLWLSRRYADRLKPGDLLLTYLFVYPLGRFLLEFLRLDSPQIAGVNANQTLMLIVALLSAGAIYWRHRTQPQSKAAETMQQ